MLRNSIPRLCFILTTLAVGPGFVWSQNDTAQSESDLARATPKLTIDRTGGKDFAKIDIAKILNRIGCSPSQNLKYPKTITKFTHRGFPPAFNFRPVITAGDARNCMRHDLSNVVGGDHRIQFQIGAMDIASNFSIAKSHLYDRLLLNQSKNAVAPAFANYAAGRRTKCHISHKTVMEVEVLTTSCSDYWDDGSNTPSPPRGDYYLTDGTPVRIKLMQGVSSGNTRPGDLVRGEVADDIGVKGHPVIERGAPVVLAVTRAEPSGRAGKGGRLDLAVTEVTDVLGNKIQLRGTMSAWGDTVSLGDSLGFAEDPYSIALGIMIYALFTHGSNAGLSIRDGVTAYVKGQYAYWESELREVATRIQSEQTNAPGVVHIYRPLSQEPKRLFDKAKVYMDGVEIACLPKGRHFTLSLDAGEYSFRYRASEIQLRVQNGKHFYIAVLTSDRAIRLIESDLGKAEISGLAYVEPRDIRTKSHSQPQLK